jgi:hypothetical protein
MSSTVLNHAFESRKEEDWRKLHNEELRDLYSPHIITVTNLERIDEQDKWHARYR